MTINHTQNSSQNKIRFIVFLCGTLTVLLAMYTTLPRLVGFVTQHVSPDRHLSERSITWLAGFRTKIILAGIILVFLSLFLDRLVNYYVSCRDTFLEKRIRLIITNLADKTRSLTHTFFDSLYGIATNEKILWSFIILIIVGIQIPDIFLSASGGLHAEGIDLNIPKNLARHGIYGTLTTRGFDDLTYRSSSGPGIFLPQALFFRLFGIHVYYGRAVHVAYHMALLFMFYYLGRYLYGKNVALLSVVMLTPMSMMLSLNASNAALCYFLIGTVFWFKSIELQKKSYLLMSGLFWAFSFQTKWLFLFAVFSIFATWIILRWSQNPLPSRYWVIPSSMVFLITVLWTGFRVFNIGLRAESFHLLRFWKEHGQRGIGTTVLQGVDIPSFATFRPIMNLSEADLWGELQLFLLIPALLYVIILMGKSKMSDYKSLFLFCFVSLWLLWWLLFNYDLPVYHLNFVRPLLHLFVAKFLYDLWNYASHEKLSSSKIITAEQQNNNPVLYSLRALIIIIILTTVIPPLIRTANNLYVKNIKFSHAFKEMVTYIWSNTEKNAVFSGWDWSLPWHIDLDDAGDHLIKDRTTYPPEQREAVPEYFIVSPEWPLHPQTDEWPNVTPTGAWALKENARRRDFLEKHASLVKTFPAGKHEWMLFKINDNVVVRPSSESQALSAASTSVQQRSSSRPK